MNIVLSWVSLILIQFRELGIDCDVLSLVMILAEKERPWNGLFFGELYNDKSWESFTCKLIWVERGWYWFESRKLDIESVVKCWYWFQVRELDIDMSWESKILIWVERAFHVYWFELEELEIYLSVDSLILIWIEKAWYWFSCERLMLILGERA